MNHPPPWVGWGQAPGRNPSTVPPAPSPEDLIDMPAHSLPIVEDEAIVALDLRLRMAIERVLIWRDRDIPVIFLTASRSR